METSVESKLVQGKYSCGAEILKDAGSSRGYLVELTVWLARQVVQLLSRDRRRCSQCQGPSTSFPVVEG